MRYLNVTPSLIFFNYCFSICSSIFGQQMSGKRTKGNLKIILKNVAANNYENVII